MASPNSTPFARNCTFVTPLIALAVAVISKFVGPGMIAPSAGLVMAATGVPTAS